MYDLVELAKKAAAIANIPYQWVLAQWQHESENFTSYQAQVYNNFAGMKAKSGDFIQFSSPDAFAEAYGRYIRLYEEDGVYQAQNVDEFVAALKHGGYFEDSYENYLNGVKGFLNFDQAAANEATTNGKSLWQAIVDKWGQGQIDLYTRETGKQPILNNSLNETFVNKELGKIGTVFVGVVMLVIGFFLFSKSNNMVLVKEGKE